MGYDGGAFGASLGGTGDAGEQVWERLQLTTINKQVRESDERSKKKVKHFPPSTHLQPWL